MSTFNDIDVECTECGEEFRGTVWVGVHAGLDPELKDLLLGGELNLVSCPECSHVAFQDHFLIYQEPAAELVAYVYPEMQKHQEAELRKMMLTGFHDAQEGLEKNERLDYLPVLLFGLEGLIEQLQKETVLAEQSQIAEVLCRQNQIAAVKLRPSRARVLETVRVIPHAGKGKPPGRNDILEGIDKLLAIDPVLDVYKNLRGVIQNNPAWSL